MEQKIYEKGVSGDACNRGRSIVTLLDGQPQYRHCKQSLVILGMVI